MNFIHLSHFYFQGVVSQYGRTYEIVHCTKEAIFVTGLASRLPSSRASILVSSVLANFLCDAGSAVDPSGLLDALTAVIKNHVAALSKYAKEHPTARIVVVPPLPRFIPDWFGTYLPGLISLLTRDVLQLSSPQIRCLAPFIAPATYFESDQVHLNSAAGVEFIRYILTGVDQAFPVIDCSRVAPVSVPTVPSATETCDLASAVRELTSMTEKFQADVLSRREQDNLVFARLKEDRDYELNKTRENRFTVSGLKLRGDQVPPRDPLLRKEFFRELLQKLVDEACPDVEPKPEVKDVYVNMRHGLGAPFIEGKMDSPASASAFRQAGSKLAKAESPNFSGLFIANAVTLTTRVRIEILRALSSVLTNDDQEAFVKGFSSRPVLCVRPKPLPALPGEEKTEPVDSGRNYTFCEAIEKWGQLLDQGSLAKAYKKARPAFNGCLEQYFVVLHELQDSENDIFDLLSGSNSHPVGGRVNVRGKSTRGARGTSTGLRGGRYPRGRRGNGNAGVAPSKRPLLDDDVEVVDSPSKVRK